MHTCLRIGLVVPALMVLACSGGGGGTAGPDSGESSGTTQPGSTGGPQTTGTTSEPDDPTTSIGTSTSTSTSTSSSSSTGEPGSSTRAEGSSGGTSEDPVETTGSTGVGSTGAVEPGPEFIPEIPDDGMPSSARFTKKPLGSTDAMQGFWEYLPPGYGGGEKYPLLIFLHGIGENGNGSDKDLDKVPATGIPSLMKQDKWPTDRPFVVLMPQHPGGGCHTAAEVDAMFEFALANYDINPARVYLTGLSCGAIGSWNYLGEHLDKHIVAMVPIAGDGKSAFNKQGCMLGKVPIWAFHGDKDDVVNFSGTTQPITGLQACDPKPEAEMVIYPGVTHDSWSMTYNLSAGHDIYAWLLEHYKQ